MIYCVVFHPIPNTWIILLDIILVKLCYFTLMIKHLACKLGQLFFVKLQGATPITKHIFILNGMHITLNLSHGRTQNNLPWCEL